MPGGVPGDKCGLYLAVAYYPLRVSVQPHSQIKGQIPLTRYYYNSFFKKSNYAKNKDYEYHLFLLCSKLFGLLADENHQYLSLCLKKATSNVISC